MSSVYQTQIQALRIQDPDMNKTNHKQIKATILFFLEFTFLWKYFTVSNISITEKRHCS